jgi:hypothetical protein
MGKCVINQKRCQGNEAGGLLGMLRKKVDGLFGRLRKKVDGLLGRLRKKVDGLLGHRRDESFMAIADDRVHAGQRGDLLRRALRVATSDQDACGWVLPMDSAQKGASGAIRLRGHAASVDDDNIGPSGTGSRAQAAVAQLGAYDFAVRPAGPTSEVLNVVCHVASLINEGYPLKGRQIQVGSDQATNTPRNPTAFAIWSFPQ